MEELKEKTLNLERNQDDVNELYDLESGLDQS